MNALWDIPELVQIILGFLDQPTQAKAALVCRTFWLQSLPLVWKTVYGLGHLLQLFPEDAVPRALKGYIDLGTFTLKRALQQSDWDRFTLHSQHIRRFVFPIDASSQRVSQELAPLFPLTTILPNLTSVRVDILEPLQPDLELVRIFLPPTVTEVELGVGQEADEQLSGYQWILEGLTAEMKLPNLNSFAIRTERSSRTDTGSSVSNILQCYQGIETLELAMGRSHHILEVLRSAAELPHLRRFKMTDPDGYYAKREPEICTLPLGSFPVLESLELCSAPDCLGTLLSRVPSKNVRNVQLKMNAQGHPQEFEAAGGTSIMDCFRTIGGFVHLKVLDVALGVRTTWDTLENILGCKELETLKIVVGWDCNLELEECHLEQMGRACRNLHALQLRLFRDYRPQTKFLKLSHLHVIATEFRNLRKLTIASDARVASNSGFSLVDRALATQYSLQELDVDMSLIDQEGEKVVGRMLALWWPNLVEVTWPDSNCAWHWSAAYEL
ncbi:hypothetical protein FS837_011850 [Tulasnella sp. UAMH 9824]|nr:hypothetical protein FS837_011850 [Tulasnella sp. UAMH 9824]